MRGFYPVLLVLLLLGFGYDAQAQFNESDIVITEINYNPPEAGTDSLEYIELLNMGLVGINLDGYTFTQGVTFTFPNFTLAPGAYAIVAVSPGAMQNVYGLTTPFQFSGGLSNSGETIELRTAATGGTLVDIVTYDDSAPWPLDADQGGPSLVLCDPLSDNSLGANWRSATTSIGVTINSLAIKGNPLAADPCPIICPDITAGLSGVVTNVACNGVSTGAVNLTVDSGTTPLTYAWSNGATTQDVTGLAAATYTVTVTDANNCTGTKSFIVTEPTALAVSVVGSNVSCLNGIDGSIDATVSGGTGAYTYMWSNGAITQDVTGLVADTYTVTVTDANGCTASTSTPITQPTAISISLVGSNVSCFNGTDGSIDATVSGGTGAYTYAWSNGATTQDVTGLAVGTYTVTVTDGNSCTTITSTPITQPATAVTVGVVGSNVSCLNGIDGSINATVSGGTGAYTYMWSNGAITQDVTGLVADTYTVTVTDANGCTASTSTPITQPTAISISLVGSNVSCFNGTNGSIDATVSGGTGAYTYLWSNGAITQDVTGLAAGTYTVTVTDANGCTASTSTPVTQPTALAISGVAAGATCNGGNNGSVTLTVTGATAPYTYLWSNTAATKDITGLAAGNYSVTVSDANGCTATDSYTVTAQSSIVLSGVADNATCNGTSTGSVDITLSGGATPYTIAWSTTAATEDITNVAAGTYTVTVTDDNGCTATDSYIVTEPTAIAVSGAVTDANCNGSTDGDVDLTVTGGTAPYTYAWSTTAATEDITNVAAGTYTVTVTDDNGCTATDSYTVTEPTAVLVSGLVTDANCNGSSDGEVDVTISGGVAPYTYVWSNAATTEDITGLAAGSYDVTVTDANGCTTTGAFTVVDGSSLSLAAVITDATCLDSLDGEIALTVTGGIAPYAFAWDNTATTANLAGLAVGDYTVTVTDANGCLEVETVTVSFDDSCTIIGILAPSVIENGLAIYPNPSSSNITVEVKGNWSASAISLHSINGAQVLYQSVDNNFNGTMTIDVSAMPVGIYVLTMHTIDGSMARAKVVVSGR